MFSVAQAWNKRKQGRKLPEWLDEEPYLPPGGEFLVEAFFSLHTCRSIGMGPGEIPWTAAMEFADRRGLDEGGAKLLWIAIRAMDLAYLEWADAEQEKRSKDRSKPQIGDRPRASQRGV